jgi:hypothetical protein
MSSRIGVRILSVLFYIQQADDTGRRQGESLRRGDFVDMHYSQVAADKPDSYSFSRFRCRPNYRVGRHNVDNGQGYHRAYHRLHSQPIHEVNLCHTASCSREPIIGI